MRWSGGGAVDGCRPIVGVVGRLSAANGLGGGGQCSGFTCAQEWASVHAPIKDMHEHVSHFLIFLKKFQILSQRHGDNSVTNYFAIEIFDNNLVTNL